MLGVFRKNETWRAQNRHSFKLPNGKVLQHFSIKAVTSDFKNDEAIFNKADDLIFKEKI